MTYHIERFLPVALGALVLLFAIWYRASTLVFFAAHNLSMDGLYNAVFGWSAIQTGFIFAVYGFVVGSEGEFIGLIRETTPMKTFLRYTRNATIIGFLLTFFSMPLMVAKPDVKDGVWSYMCIAVWFALFVWAFFSFMRVAYLFGILLKQKVKAPIPG